MKELYTRISGTTAGISRVMIENELERIIYNPESMTQGNFQNSTIPINSGEVFQETSAGGMLSNGNRNNMNLALNFSYNSDNGTDFAKNLIDFMYSQGHKNLKKAFDDYADAGATFNGMSIKDVPALNYVYRLVSSSNNYITESQLGNAVTRAFREQEAQPMFQLIVNNINSTKNLSTDQKNRQLRAIFDSKAAYDQYMNELLS